jgi:hypothetical protein
MPSTVAELFAAARLPAAGAVRWGTPVRERGPGNYVVALTDDVQTPGGYSRRPRSTANGSRTCSTRAATQWAATISGAVGRAP